MDELQLLQRVVDETTRVIDHVSDAEMASPSPCDGWTVRDVVNHITGGATMFALSVEHGKVADEELGRLMGGDNLGDDPKGAWNVAAEHALAAFERPDAMDAIGTLAIRRDAGAGGARHRRLRRAHARGRHRVLDRSAGAGPGPRR